VCGRVTIEGFGTPIVSAVCDCDDCQEGGRRIEALPGAAAVLDPSGGTSFLLFRRDRFICSEGVPLVERHKLKEASPTNRVVATCCNTAMFLTFDKGPFWVSAYRGRFHGDVPPPEMRVCTRVHRADVALADDVPNYPGYPPRFMIRLLAAGVAMLLERALDWRGRRPRS
jgi:hypothetical protein